VNRRRLINSTLVCSCRSKSWKFGQFEKMLRDDELKIVCNISSCQSAATSRL